MYTNRAELNRIHPGWAKNAQRRALRPYIEWQQRDLPTLSYEVCLYLSDNFGLIDSKQMSFTLSALGHWHKENNFPDPTASPSVIELLRQIKCRTPRQTCPSLQLPISINDVIYLSELYGRQFSPEMALGEDRRDNETRKVSSPAFIALRNRAILLIAFWFGLATREVCKLTKDDLHITKNTIKITANRLSPNGGRERYSFQITRLPLLCPLAAIEDWLAHSGSSTHYIFSCASRPTRTTPVTSRTVQSSFKKLMSTHAGPPRNTRSLRYSLYFFLIDNGWSRRKILKYAPFYISHASKTRVGKTQRDRDKDRPEISPEHISSILLAIENSLYRSAYNKKQ
ncbi:tyrosine-type recombinase/integrase [Pseudomonas jinjuensis]|uniref:Phage integrase family protein n=2 Tax=Pseudomonas jinjuensis TaxID=198616 RepID=A0A1H0EF32_9PSED|nr:Phage integrase family protein [Pseudomonas jinjuensis]